MSLYLSIVRSFRDLNSRLAWSVHAYGDFNRRSYHSAGSGGQPGMAWSIIEARSSEGWGDDNEGFITI